MDCPSHQLDLFIPVGVQTQVKQYRDVEFLPMGAIQQNAPISFHVPKSPFYVDPRQMYFLTVVEIVAGNGQSPAEKSFTDDSDPSKLKKVGVINYLGETLWQQMDFRINDTPSILPTVSMRIKAMWKLFYFTRKQKLKPYPVDWNFLKKTVGISHHPIQQQPVRIKV